MVTAGLQAFHHRPLAPCFPAPIVELKFAFQFISRFQPEGTL